MPVYVVLGNYTEQGVRNIKQMADLRQAAEQWTEAQGGRVVANYTTLGPYDFVFIVELPSPEVALEGAFLFGSQGEVRTQTMLAFPTQAAEAIARRLPRRGRVVELEQKLRLSDSSTARLRDGSIRAMWPRLAAGHCARLDAGAPERGRRRGRHRPSSPT